ncbi:MAG: ketoacyl-ACP synthase III [Coriobacteriia bacterium]|nr:ketoacyl-ACP synthase III [Coriobacteriia bacterium]
MNFKIAGTGSATPKLVVSNDDLARVVETDDEWIVTRTGISTRHVLSTETLTELAVTASRRALEAAGVTASELDLIIGATTKHDYQVPALACVVQAELGAPGAPAFDVNFGCTGFVGALDIAARYFETGGATRAVLIICAEALTRYVDWTDRATCVLFGDGAAAVVLTPGSSLLATHIHARGNPDPLHALAPTGNSPYSQNSEEHPYIEMNGREVFKFAVTNLCSDVTKVMEQARVMPEEVDLFLVHQANKRIIEAARERLGQPPEKFPTNIERYGNTSAASIPLLLDELVRAGKIEDDALLACAAFGAGLISGAALIRM